MTAQQPIERGAASGGGDIRLRDVEPRDIEVFYEQQLDPDATSMAAFPARDREAHFSHWQNKVLGVNTNIARTIEAEGRVAGNIGSWLQDGEREVGYWIGKPFWGKGVATAALVQFLVVVEHRPLFAWAAKHNIGSIRVLEKAGFRFDRDEDTHSVYRLD